MKILVISDSHGNNLYLNRAIEQAGTFDYFLHLGDLEGSEHFIETFVDVPKVMIAGNNDYYIDVEPEAEIDLDGHHIFMAHGHQYHVYTGVKYLREEAQRRGADIVLYGHTHVPYMEQTEEMLILNPGSISLPRQKERIPTYAIIELKEDGTVKAALYEVE